MKRSYKILLSIFLVELIVIIAMKISDIKVESPLGSAIGSLLFVLPIQILLFLLSKDDRFSKKQKTCFNIVFWFINICFLSGGIALFEVYINEKGNFLGL